MGLYTHTYGLEGFFTHKGLILVPIDLEKLKWSLPLSTIQSIYHYPAKQTY
jgi:hypothetical protein